MNKVFISCKETRIENNRSFYGCFYLGSFDYGLSLTVANALRRTLLAECPGLGIVSVTIENVTHEYSTLPGVRESVLDMLLNFKEIVLKKTVEQRSTIPFPKSEGYNNMYQPETRAKPASANPILGLSLPKMTSEKIKQEPVHFPKNASWPIYKNKLSIYDQVGGSYLRPVVGYLKVKGPGVIRAKDLILPSFIQCVDPEQYIATLSEDGTLCMKFIIMEGKNDYIQKKNSFINFNVVKKRQAFLTELFQVSPQASSGSGRRNLWNLTKSESLAFGQIPKEETTISIVDSAGPETKALSFGESETPFQSLKENTKVRQSQISDFNALPNSPFILQSNKQSKTVVHHLSKGLTMVDQSSTAFSKQKQSKSKLGNLTIKQTSLFRNSLPLHLDTVFNPVTKVNYIIEENLNKLVEDSTKKTMLIDEITSLIESSHFLKENLPFLAPYALVNFPETKLPDFDSHRSPKEIAMVEQNLKSLQTGQGQTLLKQEELEAQIKLFDKQLSSLVNTYEKSDLTDLNISLYPLQKETKNHTIILEIWTNGSIHPSEVLKIGLTKLSSVFLQFQKSFSNINFSTSSSLTLHSK